MAKAKKAAKNGTSNDETLMQTFWRGFFWPVRQLFRGLWWIVRAIGRGLAWLGHRPPVKQIGHGLRWFFRLRPVRFIGRLLGFSFFAGSARELKQVTWLTWRESRRLTGAVILFAVVFGVLIAAVDFGLDKLFKQVILK